MKIKVEVNVFGDPQVCNSKYFDDYCIYLDDRDYCGLFEKELKYNSKNFDISLKCDECLKAERVIII